MVVLTYENKTGGGGTISIEITFMYVQNVLVIDHELCATLNEVKDYTNFSMMSKILFWPYGALKHYDVASNNK